MQSILHSHHTKIPSMVRFIINIKGNFIHSLYTTLAKWADFFCQKIFPFSFQGVLAENSHKETTSKNISFCFIFIFDAVVEISCCQEKWSVLLLLLLLVCIFCGDSKLLLFLTVNF